MSFCSIFLMYGAFFIWKKLVNVSFVNFSSKFSAIQFIYIAKLDFVT